jgi:hypothetical protein
MARLTAADRKHLPMSDFGLEHTRQFPMPDRAHAANAKARASAQVHKGAMSQAQAEKIDAKADRVLGESEGRETKVPGHAIFGAKPKATVGPVPASRQQFDREIRTHVGHTVHKEAHKVAQPKHAAPVHHPQKPAPSVSAKPKPTKAQLD